MRTIKATVCIALALVCSVGAIAESLEAGDSISFVACPVVRDTKTVPCWYSQYDGVNYFLGIQQDIGAEWYPPQLKHKVLVEGIVTDKMICGAVALESVHTSVLPELSLECDTVLPAEPDISAPHGERGAGPNTEEPGAGGRRPRPEPPQPPFTEKQFTIHYDFDGVQIYNREFAAFRRAINYANASKAKTITAMVYRGSALLSNGTMIEESKDRVLERARGIEDWFAAVDLPQGTKTHVETVMETARANGETDYDNRRVVLTVLP